MSRLIRSALGANDYVAWRAPDVALVRKAAAASAPDAEDPATVRERARREGFEQGHAAGIDAATRELREQVAAAERILDALARPLEELDHRVEEELLALVQAIVRQLVRREMNHDPGHIIGLIREGLAALPLSAGDVVVRLHPDDAGVVQTHLSDAPVDRAWRVEADALLERGGCVISSARSTIDGRLDTRLARVIAGLLEDERAEAR